MNAFERAVARIRTLWELATCMAGNPAGKFTFFPFSKGVTCSWGPRKGILKPGGFSRGNHTAATWLRCPAWRSLTIGRSRLRTVPAVRRLIPV